MWSKNDAKGILISTSASIKILSRWWCIPRSTTAASVAERSYSKAGIMDLASPSVCLDTVIFQFCAVTYNYEVYISNDTNEISLTGV